MAVSICRSCSVALCKGHLVSSFYSDRVPQYGCDHHPEQPFLAPREAVHSMAGSAAGRDDSA